MGTANGRLAAVMTVVFLLSACHLPSVYEAERKGQQAIVRKVPELYPYNVPPQVVYRIDDHRFVTLENYNYCFGYAWYNNTQTGVRTRVGLISATEFHGRLIIDDPTEMNVAIPRVTTGLCGDRGCIDYVAYSTDGGRSFNWVRYDSYEHTRDPVESSRKYVISVTQDAMYITMFKYKYVLLPSKGEPPPPTYDLENDRSITDLYPLAPGYIYGRDEKLPEGVERHTNVRLPSGLRTPSGDDRFTCDESIHDPEAPTF